MAVATSANADSVRANVHEFAAQVQSLQSEVEGFLGNIAKAS